MYRRVISRSYVIDGSQSGDLSWDRFPNKLSANMDIFVPENVFSPRRIYIIFMKNVKKVRNLKTSSNLKERYFLLNCRRVVFVISCCVKQYRWRRTSLCGFLKKSSNGLWRVNAFSPLWKLHPNKLPHSFLSRFCCSLLVRINTPYYFGDSFNKSRLLGNFYNVIILFAGSGPDSLPPSRTVYFRAATGSPSLAAVCGSAATRRHLVHRTHESARWA